MAKAVPIAVLVATVGLADGAAADASRTGLQPHRAAYRLTLQQPTGIGPFTEATGGLVIEWGLTCDGWLSNQRLSFVAATEDGANLHHDVRYSSWEASDGSRLRYTIRSFEGADVIEEFRGEAWITPGKGGTAAFRMPEAEEVELPPGAVFPTDHLQQVLEEARRGSALVTHQVFDGWGLDALTMITTVIGRQQTVELDDDEASADGTTHAWPMSMAYFDVEGGGELPDFEASFLLTENGVLRDLALDYGDFTLDAALEELELLPKPDC